MNSEKGFGVVSFLALMPFLVSIITLIAGAAFLFKADAHLKHECRVSVLKSQHEVAEKLEQLMALNPKAAELREAHEAAQQAMRDAEMTGEPVTIGIATATLVAVQFARSAFAVKQKALILKAVATSLKAPVDARSAVLSAVAQESISNSRSLPRTKKGFPRPGLFRVVAEPADDLTPDYNPAPNFSKSQTVNVDIKVAVADLLPEWLRKFLPMDNLEISSHCQSTIVEDKGTKKWVETLNAVK